jgi:hypothetical protein
MGGPFGLRTPLRSTLHEKDSGQSNIFSEKSCVLHVQQFFFGEVQPQGASAFENDHGHSVFTAMGQGDMRGSNQQGSASEISFPGP